MLLGADDIIPMARVVDGTTLGNEREYARTFNTNNELVSSLSYGIVLTDDPYADAHPVKIGAGELYVPDLAVGRLVERRRRSPAAGLVPHEPRPARRVHRGGLRLRLPQRRGHRR